MIKLEMEEYTYDKMIDILAELRMYVKDRMDDLNERDFVEKYTYQILWDELGDILDDVATSKRKDYRLQNDAVPFYDNKDDLPF